MKIVVFLVLLTSLVFVQSTEKTRTSQLKCQEYNELSKKNNICNDSPILDGIVQLKDYPFVGVIGFDDEEEEIKWTCSGILISNQYAVTTAHCTVHRALGFAKYVRFGETALSSPNPNAVTYGISQIIRHPSYKAPVAYNDIALLKLDRLVNFTDYIRPACLYTGPDLPKYNVAGFSFADKYYEIRQGILLHENSEVVSKENCSETFETTRKMPRGVDYDLQFCSTEGPSACTLHSGAPLLHKEEELRCMQSIAGITALGKGRCHNKPGLNVKISAYIDWIESVAWA